MNMVKIWTAGTAILAMYKCIPSPFPCFQVNLAKVKSRREQLPLLLRHRPPGMRKPGAKKNI